jgi:hypothetical protein
MARPQKRLLDPRRERKIHGGFSWIDRRFLRDGWLEKLASEDILLYFFLVAVADQQGLSYYSDPSLCAALKITQHALEQARSHLLDLELIAYERPLYQVLALDVPPKRTQGFISLSELFHKPTQRKQEP